MEERDSTTLKATKLNYLNLLQEIEKLSNLSSNLTDLNISNIETIFNNVTENIDRIWNQMAFEKSSLFLITILNTMVRVSVIDASDLLISHKSFQSMFDNLNQLILSMIARKECSPMCAKDILDSILMNLVKDDFIEICLKRLHLNKTVSTIGNILVIKLYTHHNNLDSPTINEESSHDDKIKFNNIFEQYIEHTIMFIDKAVIQSKYEFRNHYSSLMISLQEFVNDCLTHTNKNVPPQTLNAITSILTFIWILTDKIALVPMFIHIGTIQKALQWTGTDTFASHINVLGCPIITILYNLSRDQNGLKQLRTEKAFDILMECKQVIDDENDEELTKCFGRALIALATSDEQSEENKKLILDTSENLYQSCRKADQDPDLKFDGYHLSEFLELLHRAFTNTYVIKHILEDEINEKPTGIQYFAGLLLTFYGALLDPEPDELEKRAVKYLLKILLQISSYPEYLKQLIDNNQFCIIIESLANRPKRDDAKRIWCNIQQLLTSNEPKKELSSMIYISYDSTNEEFCREFIKELRKKITIPIWVDYEKIELGDDTWEYVSPIIISATVVIILISTAYGDSTDKFQELSYIISTNKSRDEKKGFIVVTTEPNFNFKRSWMKDLLQDKTIVPCEDNISHMASKVRHQIGIPKKSLIKCLQCQVKSVQKKKVQSDDILTNSEDKNFKSITTNDSNPAPAKVYIQKESSNTTNDTDVLITTKKHSSYSIVTGLITQTGSAGDSTQI